MIERRPSVSAAPLLLLALDSLRLSGARAHSVAAPKLCNKLPLHIWQTSSLSVFKSSLGF